MQPVPVVQAQGIDAVFECRYPGAQSYNWGLNGAFHYHNSPPPNVTVTPPSGDIPTKLIISTAQYNNTVVQCEAVVRAGPVFIPKLSVNATLQVQGKLLCAQNNCRTSANFCTNSIISHCLLKYWQYYCACARGSYCYVSIIIGASETSPSMLQFCWSVYVCTVQQPKRVDFFFYKFFSSPSMLQL